MIKSAFILIALTALTASVVIDNQNRVYRDAENRSLIFHGMNVVYKSAPYFPVTDEYDPEFSFSEKDYEIFKDFGFNVVRLGVIWEAVEKVEGTFDEEFLEKVSNLVTKLGERGIYVIIDAHQDMFSRLFCGEGVPTFYAKNLTYSTDCKSNILSHLLQLAGACIPLKNFNWEYDKDDLPLIKYCKQNFLKYHQSPELTTIYDSFYKNENGIQDKFAEFWKVIAAKFKNHENVIGFDIWNEPWPGNLWSDIYSMFPGHADNHQILPFYKKIDKAIREVHKDFIFMFEPVPFPDTLPFFGGKALGGFKETPSSDDKLDKQVLNVHNYCCQARHDVCSKGEPSIEDAASICPAFHKHKLLVHAKQAQELGVPVFVTEFGACSGSDGCYYEMEGFLQAADHNLVSWAYWMYKPYGDHTTTADENSEGIFNMNGSPQPNKVKALTRTYIQAYQGVPLSSQFDPETSSFSTLFEIDLNVKAPSVLYLNEEIFYKEGFELRVTDEENQDVEYSVVEQSKNYVKFIIEGKEKIKDGQVVIVRVSKKQN